MKNSLSGSDRRLIPIFILAMLTMYAASCAHDKYGDRDRTDPRYYEGTGVAVSDSASVSALQKNPNQLPPPDHGPDAATGSLIESAISLVAYPDYYKQSTIHGACIYKVDSSIARVPCRHMHLNLVSADGKTLGRTETNENGEFAFYVVKDKIYFLVLDSSRYKLAEEDRRPLSMGADVTLHALLAN